MVKLLTINSHSWMEEDPQKKLEILGKTILENDYDVICVQEVNQLCIQNLLKICLIIVKWQELQPFIRTIMLYNW